MPEVSFEMLATALAAYIVTVLAGLTAAAMLTGWARLRAAHHCDGDCPRPFRYGSVFFGSWMTYALTTRVSSDKWALHLSAMPFVFAPTHAPIAVNWSDITVVRRAPRWFGWVYEVEVRDLPGLQLSLGLSAWRWVAKAAEDAGVRLELGETAGAEPARKN